MCRTWDVPPSSHVRNLRRGGHPPKESSCSPERVIFPGCNGYVRSGVAAGPPVPRLLRLAALRRLPLAAAELEPAARALPRPVAPLHRGAAAEAALGGRLGAGAWNHASERRKSPGRGVERERNGRPCGRPENGVLREAR